MPINSKIILLSAFAFLLATSVCQAEPEALKKGVAHGTFMMQGYSGLEAPGTLRFYAVGAQAEESSLSYVDDAYISLDNDDYQGNPYELKGRFTGGPNGVATFVNNEGLSFSVPLKDGRTFDLSIPGVQVHMTVADPSIFLPDEEDLPADYDPNAPLTDSGARPADIEGQVEIACPPNFDAWDVLKRNTVIYNHCRLKTGEESKLRISFANATTFEMKPETEIVINELRQEKSKISLIAGKIWANVKKMVKGEDMSIEGSQAVAGIKGTTFMMEDTGASTTLKVVEGEVEFKDKADGKTETVRTGEALAVDLRGFGTRTTFDPAAQENDQRAPKTADKTQAPPQTKPEKTNYLYWLGGIGLALVLAVAGYLIRKRKV